jgi:hypothetical protein
VVLIELVAVVRVNSVGLVSKMAASELDSFPSESVLVVPFHCLGLVLLSQSGLEALELHLFVSA